MELQCEPSSRFTNDIARWSKSFFVIRDQVWLSNLRGGRKAESPRGPTSVGVFLGTYFLHLVEEADEPGHSSESDQAEDPHEHQYPHHLVGLGRVVVVVVVQVLGDGEITKKGLFTFFSGTAYSLSFVFI